MNTEPKNLADCLIILQESTPADIMEKLKSGELTTTSLHHTAGRSIRNNWKLWGNSDLEQWFQSIGIWHPDDMSSIILDSFVKTLKGEPIDLEGQVKFYQDYWEKMNQNPKSFSVEYTKDGKVNII